MEPSGIHGFDLVGVMVRDANKAIAFYKNVLGLEPTEEFPNGAEFQLADGAFFGVWQPPDGEDIPGGKSCSASKTSTPR